MIGSVLPLLHSVDLPCEVIDQGHRDVVDVLLAHHALSACADNPSQNDSKRVVFAILINSTRPHALDVGKQRVFVDVVTDNSRGVSVGIAERDVRHVLGHQCAYVLDSVVCQHFSQSIRS